MANQWQIGFDWIRCRCLVSQNTFICNVFSWSRLGEPSLRSSPPRTYALRAVRQPPKATLLLVHTPAYPAMLGHTHALFKGISGAFCARV